MTSVYVTNVVKRVTVTPGATGGSGGGGGGTDITPLNNTWSGTQAFNGTTTTTASSSSTIPVIVKGAASQSVALTDWRNSANSSLASVDQTGTITTVTNVLVGGGVSAGGGNKVIVLSNATAPSTNPTGGGILYAESGALKYRDASGGIHVPIPASGTKGDLLVHTGTAWVKVSAGTNNDVLTADSTVSAGVKWAAGGGSGSGHIIQDESVALTQRSTLDFQGAGVVATDSGSKTIVTITGGSSFYQTLQTNGTPRTQRAAANYSTAFTLTDNSGSNRTDIAIVSDQAAGTASLRTLGSGSTQAAAGDHTHSYELVGVAAGLISSHLAASNAHPEYLSQTEADALYAGIGTAPPTGGTTGQVLAKATNSNYSYVWQTGSASLSIPYNAVGTSTGTVPFSIQGIASQTADLFQVKNSAATVLFAVNNAGEASVGSGSSPSTLLGTLNMRPTSATRMGMVIRNRSSQSANTLEVQDNAGIAVMSIGPTGTIVAPNIGPMSVVLASNGVVPPGTPAGSIIFRRP